MDEKLRQADVFFRRGEEEEKDPLYSFPAREAFLKCAQLRREVLGDQPEIARLLLRAVRLWRSNRRGEAMEKMLLVSDALSIFTKTGCKLEVADCYTRLGLLHLPRNCDEHCDFASALMYLTLAIQAYDELEVETPLKVIATLNRGVCYQETKDGRSRLSYIEALELSRRVHGAEHWQTYLCARHWWTTFHQWAKEEPENTMWECFPLKAEVRAMAKWHADALRPQSSDDCSLFPPAAQADRFEAVLQREIMIHLWEPQCNMVVHNSPAGEPVLDNAMEIAEIDPDHRLVRKKSVTELRPGKVTVRPFTRDNPVTTTIYGG